MLSSNQILKAAMSEIIDLKSKLGNRKKNQEIEEKIEFQLHHIDTQKELPKDLENKAQTVETSKPELTKSAPEKTIEINFQTFSELIKSSNSEKTITENSEETVIISANLLAKLASSNEESTNNKLPIIFCIGIIIGLAFAWIIFNEL
jgi:hypothetical protein